MNEDYWICFHTWPDLCSVHWGSDSHNFISLLVKYSHVYKRICTYDNEIISIYSSSMVEYVAYLSNGFVVTDHYYCVWKNNNMELTSMKNNIIINFRQDIILTSEKKCFHSCYKRNWKGLYFTVPWKSWLIKSKCEISSYLQSYIQPQFHMYISP